MSQLAIDRVAFLGRTMAEYVRMFDLTPVDLAAGPILDCPSGAASFTAEATAAGLQVVAADIAFDQPADALVATGQRDLDHVLDRVTVVPELYLWDTYRTLDELRVVRQRALNLFATDFAPGLAEGRYRHVALPSLPFATDEFALALSGHFLFLYSDRFTLDFHLASVAELLRVSREVRIYPLVGLDTQPSPYLAPVLAALDAQGYTWEMRPVASAFQRGANQVLRITR